VAGVTSVFATSTHRAAACDALLRLSYDRRIAEATHNPIPSGLGYTTRGMQIQVDLL